MVSVVVDTPRPSRSGNAAMAIASLGVVFGDIDTSPLYPLKTVLDTTGAFSMTHQATQLGWLPRLVIAQTSASGYGQIYVGPVNWLLMIVTIGLTFGFGKSDNLTSAYGIAVSATMLMTMILLFIAMREIWDWSGWPAIIAGAPAIMDTAFLGVNLTKIADGGYVPILPAADRLRVSSIAPGVWRGVARLGFMERPDILEQVTQAHAKGCGIDPTDLTYFVGEETAVGREGGKGLPHWLEAMFAFMQRNSLHVTDYFRLPAETMVELGRTVAI